MVRMPDLRVISPCEHGIEHHIRAVNENAEFWIPECKDARGRQRYHRATPELYKTTLKST